VARINSQYSIIAQSGGVGQTGRIAFLLFFLMALSFAAQPIMYRPMGLPISLCLVALFNFNWLVSEFRVNIINFLIGGFFVCFLISSDLLIGVGFRGTILALLLVFSFFGSRLKLSEKDLYWIWTALTWVSFFLASLGTYRYLNGYVAPMSENTGGILELKKSYFYLGISYLPATRNSDSLYFVVGFVAALRLALSGGKLRYLYYMLALLQVVVILLTLARWSFVATFLASFLILERRQKRMAIAVIIPLLLVFISVSLYSFPRLFEQIGFLYLLIKTGIISIFDVTEANHQVSGFYTYSNNDRIDLYLASFQKFLDWPFGQGIDNTVFGNANSHTAALHSENLFLDMLIIFGVLSLGLFVCAFKKFFLAIRLYKNSLNARVSIATLSVCIVFAMLNSPVNLVIFWFIMTLGFAEINRAKEQNV
jgi:hypothetical protein